MFLLYCDETNMRERAGDFLIYGGLVVNAATSQQFSLAIDELRRGMKIPREHRLKFNPRPDFLTHIEFSNLKQSVIEICREFDAKLTVYLILHDVATNPDVARRNGINQICFNFDAILRQTNSPGLVVVDRFNDEGNIIDAHLRDKFAVGVKGLPYSPELRLTNIVGFHYSAIGQSHFPSVIDILLGSLRFAVNAHTQNNQGQIQTATKLLGMLSPLFWRKYSSDPIPEIGLILSPKVIRSAKYRASYESLKGFLSESGVAIHQNITDTREY